METEVKEWTLFVTSGSGKKEVLYDDATSAVARARLLRYSTQTVLYLSSHNFACFTTAAPWRKLEVALVEGYKG